jgi:hypothetical protein
MKGLVLNLLEETVRRHHTEAAWEAVLDAAEVDGAFTTIGNYADDDFRALLAASARVVGQSESAFTRWFGERAIEPLAERFPKLFAHTSTRAFLLTLNHIIHPEVRKLHPGADVPHFDYLPSTASTIVMRYASKRQLCAFAEGLIAGAATHFAERASIEQRACMLRGDEHCLFVITFAEERHG